MALTSPAIRRICQCLYLLRRILSAGSSRPLSPFLQARRPRGALAIGGGRIRAVGDAVLAIAARASMDGRERNQGSWTTLDDGASGARPKPRARSAGAWSKSLAACTRPGAGAGCFPSFPSRTLRRRPRMGLVSNAPWMAQAFDWVRAKPETPALPRLLLRGEKKEMVQRTLSPFCQPAA